MKQLLNKLNTDYLIQMVLHLYLVILGFVFPLYMTRHKYTFIANDKYAFFRWSSLIMEFSVIILLIIHSAKDKNSFDIRLMNAADASMCLFFLCVTVSFFFSVKREEAFTGSYGWFLGFQTYIILFLIYYLYSHVYQWKKNDTLPFLGGSFIVIFLAVLNRYRLFLVEPDYFIATHISTIGNINWLAGYISVMFPLGAGIYISRCFDSKAMNYFMIAYVLAGWLGILTNGSNSLYLTVIAMTALLALLAFSSYEVMKRVLICAILFGIACVILYVSSWMIPIKEFYKVLGDENNLAVLLVTGPQSFLPAVLFGVLYWLSIRKHSICLDDSMTAKLLKIIYLIGFLVLVFLLAAQLTDLIRIPDNFGHNRGFIWRLSGNEYKGLPLFRKLIGVGPDCFGCYTLLDWDFMTEFLELYPGTRLPSAHSEPLTTLFNLGAAGMVSYLLVMFVHLFKASFYRTGVRGWQIPVILSMVSYHVNLLVSFQSIVSLPFLFLLLAYTSGLSVRSERPDNN